MTPPPRQAATLEDFARRVVASLATRRIDALAALVHPDRGVLFSPYGYVERAHAVVLTPAALRAAWAQDRRLVWGREDGTGDPIELGIRAYFGEHLYAQDFAAAPAVASNRLIGKGNSPSNLEAVFPDAEFVEFHFPGFNPAFGGMDWRSLRVVVTAGADGGWWLTGLVNDRWTI